MLPTYLAIAAPFGAFNTSEQCEVVTFKVTELANIIYRFAIACAKAVAV